MKKLHIRSSIYGYIVFITTIALGTMISCSPTQKESNSIQVQQPNQVPNTIVKSDTSVTVLTVPETVPTTTTSNESKVINVATTPPELNPAHGQPYHRCDIPVGSPLKTAAAATPTKPATVTTSAAPAITAPQINRTGTGPTLENAARLNSQQTNNRTAPMVANTNTSPPKINPPHGQPYHRCDIPVGSALN